LKNKDELKELITGGSLITLGVVLLKLMIPGEVDMSETDETTSILVRPDFWPKIVSWLMIIVGCIYSGISASKLFKPKLASKNLVNQSPLDQSSSIAVSKEAILRWTIVAVIMFIFLIADQETGLLIPSAAIFLIASLGFSMAAGYLRFAVAILLPLLLAAFFDFVANVPIPIGFLKFLAWA
jgi:hypothetical protein